MATFTVTNTNASGAGSLRQAILDANAAPGADEIEFAATLSGQPIPAGRLAVLDDLTINGVGDDDLTVIGGFVIGGNGNAVLLTGMTIQSGRQGVEIVGTGHAVTVADSRITRQSDDGVSIGETGFASNNTLIVKNSILEQNEDNIGVERSDNNIIVTHSTIRDAREDGIEIDGNNNRVTVENSTISNNGTIQGRPNDGLDVNGSGNLLTIEQVIFSANTEDGLDIEGTDDHAIVNNSTFTGNGRDGILVQDPEATSTVVVENAGGGDLLLGGGADDKISGRSGVDRLGGGGGHDELDGGAGGDFLNGGAGDDVLRGGSGRDTFRFDDDSGGFDIVEDFRRSGPERDVLQLDISEDTFRMAFGPRVTAADRGVDALDPDDGRGSAGGELVIDFRDPGIPGGAPGDSVLTIVGINELRTDAIDFV